MAAKEAVKARNRTERIGLRTHQTTSQTTKKWTFVGQKALKPKAGTPTAQQKRVAKLKPSRSAAIVLTLLPAAIDKGVTYADAIKEAKSKIDLDIAGIPDFASRRDDWRYNFRVSWFHGRQCA